MASLRNKSWKAFPGIKFWLHIFALFGVSALVPRTSSRSVRRSLKILVYCCVINVCYFCTVVFLPGPFHADTDVRRILNFGDLLAYVATGRGSSVMCLLMTKRMSRFLNRVLKNATKFPHLVYIMLIVYFAACIFWRLVYSIARILKISSYYYIIVTLVVYFEALTISVTAILFTTCQVLLFCCFRELNKKLTQNFNHAKNPVFNVMPPKKKVVRNLRRLHDELCDAAEDLDLVQGPVALLLAVFNFILMTSTLYKEAKYSLTVATVLPGAYGITKMLWHILTLTVLIWCNTITAHEADETVDLVHNIMHETRDPIILKELKIFSLQLLHRKIRFTACGFFPLDFTLLCTMLGAVSAYLVILIQFQQGYEERAKGTGTSLAEKDVLGL